MAVNLNLFDPCVQPTARSRRLFWATQSHACGQDQSCGETCSLAGLEYEEVEGGRTIKTTDWVRSLILNILNTRARSDVPCPTPNAVFGHWSESYRTDGLHIGTRVWNAASKSYPRIADSVIAIRAAIQADLSKLVAMGVVTSIDVAAEYIGKNQIAVEIVTTASTGRSQINLSGAFVTGNWAWH